METPTQPKMQVLMLPSPGIGHLLPAMELARRLCEHHNISVTSLTSPWMYPEARISAVRRRVTELGLDIRFLEMPDAALTDQEIQENTSVEARLTLLLRKTKPHVKRALESLAGSASAFVTDFFCSELFDAAADTGIPVYVFFVSTAAVCSLMLDAHRLLFSTYTGSFHENPDVEIKLPGLRAPVRGRDMLSPLQVRGSDAFTAFVGHCARLAGPHVSGILINTFSALEGPCLAAAAELLRGRPVRAVGPVVYRAERGRGVACVEWLDAQPARSVVYVSFGSGGSVSREQGREIAQGLEASGHRFLWVLKLPPPAMMLAKGFAVAVPEADPAELLPEGFLERTAGRGMVVTTWVPQSEVLAHAATGGFVTHCGWNSILESIVGGVPMIPWPLFAEQHLNRRLLLREFEVAVDLGREDDGFVKAEGLERALRELMEGEGGGKARENVGRLARLATAGLEKGGESWEALAEMVGHWSRPQRMRQ